MGIQEIKIFCVIIFTTLILGSCKKEQLPDPPYYIEVYTQEDVDLACTLINEEGVFEGTLLVYTKEALNYECFSKLRVITNTFLVLSPNGTKYLSNLERVEGEGFMFCDPMTDTISFPSLVEVNGDFGSPFDCTNYKAIIVPKLRTAASVILGTTALANGPSQLSYVKGMDDLKNCRIIEILSRHDSLLIDGFRNLEVTWDFFSVTCSGGKLTITPESFQNLQQVRSLSVGSGTGHNINFSSSFSSVDSCDLFICVGTYEAAELCPFVPRLKNGKITRLLSGNLTQAEIIAACE